MTRPHDETTITRYSTRLSLVQGGSVILTPQHHSHTQAAMPHIPGYRISRVIGHGGMSTVYLGTQLSLGREVAIKVMRAEVLADEVSRRRFENEARTIARLEHPHIVNIHEVGRTSDGLPWHSMPYLGRGHLGQCDLTGNHARIRKILESLLSALSFAHARGVVHRDVKAENVLFDESNRPLLADFGIALRRGHGTRVTLTGLAIGSTAYMAPEQARGQQVDLRADLYSVGVLAWEMLTGQLPYQADDAVAMAVAHVQRPLPRLPFALRHWQRFMRRALAKQPHKRFHNADHMLAVLRAIPQASGAHRLHWRWLAGSAVDFARAHRGLAGAGLAVAFGVSIGLVLSLASRPAPNVDPLPGRTVTVPDPEGLSTTGTVDVPVVDSVTLTSTPPPAHRPQRAPTSIANQRLEQLQVLLADPAPTPPQIRQSIDLLLAAHKANPEHLRLPAARDTLLRTLGLQVVAAIEDGDDVRVQALLRQLPRIRAMLPRASSALDGVHSSIFDALNQRIESSLDLAIARRSLETALLAGLGVEQIAGLRTRVRALEPPSGWESVRVGGRLLHIDHAPVSRSAYARFAEATGRPAAICRERGSVLRLMAPRDWSRPGFAQSGSDPVVCISWQDATDYATWASQRDGRRYRLLSMEEAASLPAVDGAADRADGRALAEWRSDCDADCTRRMVSGRSWRSRQELRPLAVERGYHDVGFRLALEPPVISFSAQGGGGSLSGLDRK